MPRPEDPAEPVAHPRAEPGSVESNSGDAALAEACRSGSLSAYEQLYRIHGPRMKSLALHLLGTVPDAEDAVQDVFLKVHRGIGNFKGQSAFSTWIYRILLNSCYDIRRKRMRRQETSEQELEEGGAPEPPAPQADHPLRLALERCVAQLGEHQRKVFLLFEVEGFQHSEIAALLDISKTASKNALYQAKKNLRALLTEERAGRSETP